MSDVKPVELEMTKEQVELNGCMSYAFTDRATSRDWLKMHAEIERLTEQARNDADTIAKLKQEVKDAHNRRSSVYERQLAAAVSAAQELEAELARLKAANAALKEGDYYARRLFKLVAPQCEPLESPSGVISQIDNFIAGLTAELARLKAATTLVNASERLEQIKKIVLGAAQNAAFEGRTVGHVVCAVADAFRSTAVARANASLPPAPANDAGKEKE